MEPFEDIVAEHGPTVLRVARAVVGPDDAEDAWSETFLAAMRAYPDLDEDVNVEAWLVTIAHRKAIDLWRAASRRAIPVGAVQDGHSRDSHSRDGHSRDGTTDQELPTWTSELWPALRALPDKQRAAVAYHHLAGLPYAEVAAIVGGTEAAARRAAADGIAALRRSRSGSHLETTTGGPR